MLVIMQRSLKLEFPVFRHVGGVSNIYIERKKSMGKIVTNPGNVTALNGNMNKLIVPETETDLNNITETKVSWVTDTTANKPESWCIVHTYKMNNNIISQVAHCTTKSAMYYRCKTNGTWQAWEELAIAPQTVTLTLSSNVGSSSVAKCVKVGRMCFIEMSLNINSNASTNAVLFTGAPVPMSDIGAYSSLCGTGKALAITVDSNGKCAVEGTPGSNTGWMNGVFAYVTNS